MSIEALPQGEAHAALVCAGLERFFGRIDQEALNALAARMEVRPLMRGQTLYRQGDDGNALHVLLTGRLQVVVRADDGTDRVLAYPSPGDTVGEMALFTGARRTAGVLAMRDSMVAELRREVFDEVLARYPETMSTIARMIIRRLTDTQSRSGTRASARSIALVPIHPGIDREDFCRRLHLSLLRFGSVARLDGATMRHRFPGAERSVERDHFLDRCEREHDFVLMLADPEPSEWTRKCVGYADRILLVAAGTESPAPTPLEIDLFGADGADGLVRPELAITHPHGHRPQGTRAWLAPRRIERHYHVGLRGNQGFHRLARFLSDRAVALVLAGGGARGFAHLGVIRALSEAGIPIDAVGGTSFGALAATGPARGFEIEQMMEELRYAFSNERPLDDYTLPIVSLVRGDRLDRLLQKYLDRDIEDLWIPYFAVSSNLSENRVEVHERGPLWRAVRASVSLPAILPPVLDNGNLLIDGGVLNNLPVDVMRDRVRGRIIAVDLSVEHEYRLGQHAVPSGLEYIKSRILPWAEPVEAPTLARVMMKTTTLASRREVELARRLAHLYLNVPLADFDLLDWGHFHAIVDTGYRYATEALEGYVQRYPEVVQGRDPIEWFTRVA